MENFKNALYLIIVFFRNYFFKKSTLYVSIAALLFSLIYLNTLSPKFLISTEVMLAESDDSEIRGRGELSSLLSLGSGSTSAIDEFILNAYSTANARYLWEKGYGQEFFSSLYIPESNTFKPKKVRFSNRIASFLLGYKPSRELSVFDLQDFINSQVKIISEEPKLSISVSMRFEDPELGKRFINDVVYGADLVAKKNTLLQSESRFNSLLTELNSSNHPKIVKDGLTNLINTNLFKMTSAKAEAPLSLNFVQEVISSENPVYPRPFLTIFSFIIIFLSIYFLSKFISNNKQELLAD